MTGKRRCIAHSAAALGQTDTGARDSREVHSCTDSKLGFYCAQQYFPVVFSRDIFVPRLTDQGMQKINDLARHYGVSVDAVTALLDALLISNGAMAQFDHRELGGAGQWMPGGMTMIGDMFNHGLKAKVDGLCSDLSRLLIAQPAMSFPASVQSQSQQQFGENDHRSEADTGSVSLFAAETTAPTPNHWWPVELGTPNGTGAQNQTRYAYFTQKHRLAIESNGHVTVYDTLDHQISGVAQQQGQGHSLTLSSQHGPVSVSTLPVVSVAGMEPEPRQPRPESRQTPGSEPRQPVIAEDADIFSKIERLADLHNKGILSSDEFTAKKAELLSRL